MSDLFTPAGGLAVLTEASVQALLAVGLVLAACALLPRLSGAVRSWLWRLAFVRILLAFFWSVPLPVPLHPPVRHAVVRPELPVPELQPSAPLPPPVLPEPRREPGKVGDLLVACWLAGAAWCLVRGGRQLVLARRLQQRSTPVTDPRLLDCWDDLLNQYGLWRAPELREVEGLGSPMLLHVRQSTVLLPSGLADEWSPEQIRMMLAHELAHVRRRDLLWGWLPTLTHSLLFFHPLVWMGSREWRLAHDSAADELALRMTGAPVADYAQLLVRLAGGRRAAPAGLALMDARDSARTLERRLKLMSVHRTARSSPGAPWPLPALLLGCAIAIPVRVIAQAPAAPALRPSTPSPSAAARRQTPVASQVTPSLGVAVRESSAGGLGDREAPGATTARTNSPAGSQAESRDRKRLRDAEQQVLALRKELDQLLRRNQELMAIQRQLDERLKALQSRQEDAQPTKPSRKDAERLSALRERDLQLGQERVAAAEATRMRALAELDRAQRALQDAQAQIAAVSPAAPRERAPAAGARRPFEFSIRLLRPDGQGDEKLLAVVKAIAPEGQWVTLQVRNGKLVPQDEVRAIPNTSQLVCVRAALDRQRLVVQIEWPDGNVDQLKVAQVGQPVRFEADASRLAEIGAQSPHFIEVTVQPLSGR